MNLIRFVAGLAFVSLALTKESSGAGLDEANTQSAAQYGEINVLEDYRDREGKDGHISFGPLDAPLQSYFDWKDHMRTSTGFNYMIEIAPQLQWDFAGDAGNTSNNETNLIGQWSVVDKSDFKRGGLMAWYQFAHTLGKHTTTEFQGNLGVILPINGGDTFPDDSAARLMLLAWEQWFLDERIRIDIGKLTTRVLLDLNRYAVSDREDHFTPVIVNNTVVPYTARIALGLFVNYNADNWYVSGLIRDADGTSNGLQFDTLSTGNWEYTAEIAWTPDNVFGLGSGIYRFIPYYTDSIGENESKQPSGWTWSLSFDQDIGSSYGAAFRYAYADEDFRSLKQRASLSFQIKQPLGFKNDRLGLGLFWGEPTNPDLGSETGAEIFWKMQLSPSLEITPGLQVIFDPALDADRSTAWIGELRLRLVL